MSTDVVVDTPTSASDSVTPPLPDDPVILKQMIQELLVTLHEREHELAGVQQRLDQLLRRLYGPKAERFDPNQPWLLPELVNTDNNGATATALPPADIDQAPIAKPKRPGHGRKPLPAELPRRRVEHALPEAQRMCPCCGEVCRKFGEEIREQLDYQPASLFVQQHVRFKLPEYQVLVAVQPPPSLLSGFGKLEHHGQARLPGAASLGSTMTQSDRCKR
jgi:hypothetical protein